MLGSSVIDYAAPICSPNLKPSNLEKIQRVQNQCLRVVTGAHLAASKEHLHHKTQTLPVDDHLDLLSRQFLAKANVASHPSNAVVSSSSGPRAIRQTLASKHDAAVAPFKCNGFIPRDSISNVIKDLHTAVVAVSINRLDGNPNRVLGSRPPFVDESEDYLPRAWRSTLCQLRSGFCRCLKTYDSVISNTGDDSCPDCLASPHDVDHLFQCASSPTTLYKIGL